MSVDYTKTFNVHLFISSTEILLDKLSEEIKQIKKEFSLKCPNCNNEARYNSQKEKFCLGCALLINACKCDNTVK